MSGDGRVGGPGERSHFRPTEPAYRKTIMDDVDWASFRTHIFPIDIVSLKHAHLIYRILCTIRMY